MDYLDRAKEQYQKGLDCEAKKDYAGMLQCCIEIDQIEREVVSLTQEWIEGDILKEIFRLWNSLSSRYLALIAEFFG